MSAWLAWGRAKVKANRLTAPLFDTRRWVADAERLYGVMATRHARGQPLIYAPPPQQVQDGPLPPITTHAGLLSLSARILARTEAGGLIYL